MRVMVIGKGGREHALCWRLNQSPSVWKVFCTIGNPGINGLATPVPIEPNDISRLADFAAQERVDLTVVGPEEPLTLGIADEFAARGLTLMGPTKAAAQLEASKSFAKQIMREAGVQTASAAVFDDIEQARSHVRRLGGPMVIKADGLAAGKGVTVCDGPEAALAAVDDAMERGIFGAAGRRVVIEERLSGQEVSFFALCDGTNALALGMAQDHKPIFDGDRGPNTGGMGAYSPVPQFDAALEERIRHEVVQPTLGAMAARGTPFRGVLFVGLMVEGERLNVLEFNVRFGDPECEALMMRLEGDLAQALAAAARGELAADHFRLSPRSAVSVVLASGGYPGAYDKGVPITGLERIDGTEPSDAKVRWAVEQVRVKVFHAGTASRDGRLVTDGGRVLVATAMASTLEQATAAAYEAADMIEFAGKHLRRDIAAKALASRLA
ncbi:MAG TPA: phosphoribosylamine--glycine ligase [Candidatus Binataceae bacterium]|jgi:phosphoribosylamine--glycine ligase|nr:phosphoribosylamine--glycine ligase [Candidatus Binataceae bacterium]